jgi:hypothetical protein
MDLLIELLAMAIYGNAIVLVHELGHAAFARVGGFRITSFAIGLGPPLLRLPLRGGVVVHLDRWWVGGSCTAIPLGPTSRRRSWYHAGGLIVQAGLALVLLPLPESWLVDRIETFNLLVAATNAVPWRIGGSASDGWFLLDMARGGRKAVEILPQRARLLRLAERERAVGSPLGTTYAELCLAWGDLLAGRADRADAFFELDPPETAVEPWIDVLYTYVRAEWHRLRQRPLAAVRTVREARLAREDEVGEDALGLLAVAEARAAVDLGATERVARALARVTGLSGPVGRQAAAVSLLAALSGSADDLEYATWRVARRTGESWLDPADVVAGLRAAADQLVEAGRSEAAAGARVAAAALSKRVRASAAAEDRPFLERRLAIPPPTSSSEDEASPPG